MDYFKNKRLKRGILFLTAFLIIGFMSFMFAKAAGNTPSLTITYDSTIISGAPSTSPDIKGLVNQDIEMKYKVTPADLGPEYVNAKVNKEIVLVLDTSGSMNDAISSTDQTYRIDALKTAAKNFIDKFKNENNVKIGIANYSTNANYNNLSLPLTSTRTDSTTLYNKINSYKRSTYDWYGRKTNDGNIEGGTNTGDGIRYALNMLNNGTSAKKFVVLMSDGEPTFYMKKKIYTQKQVWYYGRYVTVTEESEEYYTDLDNNSNPIVAGPGNADDSAQNCLNYASIMAAKIKESNYTSYNIAYSSGGSAEKMKTLATSAGGKYFSALDSNAINNVFNEIGDQIKDSYAVGDVSLKFSVPEGMEYAGETADVTIDGTTYTQKLPDILYKFDSVSKMYKADPFYISFKMRATKSGTYDLPQNAFLNYKGIDGNLISIEIKKAISYVANNLTTDGTPVINVNIEGQSPNPGVIGQDLTLKCKINPENFQVFEATNGTKAPSYSFKAKLKFNLQGKFDIGAGLIASTNSGYDVETPEFDVIYKLDSSGSYVPEPSDFKYFTIKVKDGVNTDNLQFGPGIVSYIDLNNKSASTNIAPYTIKIQPPIQLEKFGLYKGLDKNAPSILEPASTYDSFNIAKGANIRLGATLTGSINNNSKLSLDIEDGILLNSSIDVYTYDHTGVLKPIGKMEKTSPSSTGKSTYIYNGQGVFNEKIIILYNETLENTVTEDKAYTNSIHIGEFSKTTNIKANKGLVELF